MSLRLAASGCGAAFAVVMAACGGAAEFVAPSTAAPGLPPVVMGCDEEIVVPEIRKRDEPPPEFSTVVGAVALQTSDSTAQPLAVEVVQPGSGDEAPLPGPQPAGGFWVKSGLMVRAGEEVELSVPPEVREALWVQWGQAGGRWTSDLTVPACEGQRAEWVISGDATEWRVFAGGFWVREPACMPLVVRAGQQEERVTIGIGAPCPGQTQ